MTEEKARAQAECCSLHALEACSASVFKPTGGGYFSSFTLLV